MHALKPVVLQFIPSKSGSRTLTNVTTARKAAVLEAVELGIKRKTYIAQSTGLSVTTTGRILVYLAHEKKIKFHLNGYGVAIYTIPKPT